MKSGTRKDYLESVGIVAIVISLVFVGYELRQNTAKDDKEASDGET